jgi:hypothetical protein
MPRYAFSLASGAERADDDGHTYIRGSSAAIPGS